MNPNETYTSLAIRKLSIRAANRITRRSLIGRLGFGMATATLGARGLILTSTAWAHAACDLGGCTAAPSRNCCGQNSIKCENLPGGSNSCPSGTIHCGCWSVGQSTCSPGLQLWWCDCCNNCGGGGSDCSCILSDTGVYHPHCCWHKTWNNQDGTCWDHVYCRHSKCDTSP